MSPVVRNFAAPQRQFALDCYFRGENLGGLRYG